MFEKIKDEWNKLSLNYSSEFILLNSIAFPILVYGIAANKGEVVALSLIVHGIGDVIYYKNVSC